jgi:hypothetical protein
MTRLEDIIDAMKCCDRDWKRREMTNGDENGTDDR